MRGTDGPPWAGTARRDTARGGGGTAALVRAWAAGLVVLLLAEYLQVTYLYGTFADAGRLEGFGGRLLLVHLPNALCVALAVGVSGRVHREPFRSSPARHAVALFAVPLFAQAVSLALQWERASVEGLSMSCAVVVVGAFCGHAADRLREGDR
ncbi:MULTISPECIES: hypothetical protein [unclassified Streptomyces]|uniref:hypothetical protein n=1 Tax=Streptomyces sp. NPDC007872 TaxID=3364782 RepID=UPI0036ADC86C